MDTVLSSSDPPHQIVVVTITGHFEDVDSAADAIISYHKEQFRGFALEEICAVENGDEFTATITFIKKDPAIRAHIQSILDDHRHVKFSIKVLEGPNGGKTIST